MNSYIYIGKIINTFGIKGELKVKSDFEYKNKVFVKGVKVYITEEKKEELINTYRIHKNYDLISFSGYSNINEVLKYKGYNIYIKREDLNLASDEYLINDLIGFQVYDDNNLIGIVIDYEKNVNNVLLKVKGEKTFYIPNIDEFILKIDLQNKKIITKGGSNLIL